MPRRTFDLSKRHDAILQRLKGEFDTTLVDVVQRALEVLEEKNAERNILLKEAMKAKEELG